MSGSTEPDDLDHIEVSEPVMIPRGAATFLATASPAEIDLSEYYADADDLEHRQAVAFLNQNLMRKAARASVQRALDSRG